MQVVLAVVAVAPDALLGVLVLDDAGEMRARGGEGAQVALRHADQEDRLRPEADDLVALLQQLRVVGRPASTRLVVDSGAAGGLMNRTTGYPTAANRATTEEFRNQLRNRRRPGSSPESEASTLIASP